MKILAEVGPVQLTCEGVYFYVLAYGERVRLPPQRAKALLYLMERADGPTVKKEDMYRDLWPSSETSIDIVSVTVSYIRRALAQLPNSAENHLETVWGAGYRFVSVSKISLKEALTRSRGEKGSHRMLERLTDVQCRKEEDDT